MKFVGSEARKLLHIARYPTSAHSKKLVGTLNGTAELVALVLLGTFNKRVSVEIQDIVNEFKKRAGK